MTPRVDGAFLPPTVVWFGHEYQPRHDEEAPFDIIGPGLRIGVNIDD